tara:strand:+ start:4351 stop:4554 length:204 start_codon:yes stop_codon:yes gene_type:complete
MSRNFTLNFWEILLQEERLGSDQFSYKIDPENCLQPRKETVDKVLAYASSVRGMKMKSGGKILVSLN